MEKTTYIINGKIWEGDAFNNADIKIVGGSIERIQPGLVTSQDNATVIDAKEKLKMLAVTGGVPRYLEEINPNLPAKENNRRICFSKEGFLYSEFDQIFQDIFSRRAPSYKRIVSALVSGRKTLSD